jgi:hypothetical protein
MPHKTRNPAAGHGRVNRENSGFVGAEISEYYPGELLAIVGATINEAR